MPEPDSINRAVDLMIATAEAFEAGHDLERAVVAAAQLLAGCTCQTERLAQAVATMELCQKAVARWRIANGRVMQIATRNVGQGRVQ
jgi:hypothetical protein